LYDIEIIYNILILFNQPMAYMANKIKFQLNICVSKVVTVQLNPGPYTYVLRE
jgi:hypothetical protein